MPRVLLVGEGPHDIGRMSWDKRTKTNLLEEGWLQTLVRRFGGDVELTAIRRDDLLLSSRDLTRHRPLPKGHGARALLAKLKAKAEGYDILVFMADADTDLTKEWREKRSLVLDGFSKIEGPGSVACLPKSASESWLLSDAAAWAALGLTNLALLPEHPEDIWGEKSDPNSNRPHNLFKRVCSSAGVSDSRETRSTLAETTAIAQFRGACPISFVAFFDDFAAALAVST